MVQVSHQAEVFRPVPRTSAAFLRPRSRTEKVVKVNTGQWYQLLGGIAEFGGLMTVAVGITKTRQEFKPDRLFLPTRAWRRVRSLAINIWPWPRKKSVVIQVGTAGEISLAGGFARAKVTPGPWTDVDIDERIERLKKMFMALDDRVDRLEDRLAAEAKARADSDAAQAAAVERESQELSERISQAAAGGLSLETWGVAFFALGIVLSTVGNLIA